MKKKYWLIGICIFMICCLSGCHGEEKKEKDGGTYIYYVNKDGTQLTKQEYELTTVSIKDQINELTRMLHRKPEDIKNKQTLPNYVVINRKDYNAETKEVTISFTSSYSKMSGIEELMSRAAVVKTLTQISGVDYVEYYVDGQPLIEGDGQVGRMKATDFIDSTGDNFNYTQDQKVLLYFANNTGRKLVSTYVNVEYDGTAQIERIIMNQLITGPGSIENLSTPLKATIPKGTKCNKISTSNGVCYIDFNKSFLHKRSNITDRVALYSIVNSLCELSTINKVQITVEGETLATFQSIKNMDSLLEADYSLISK